MPLPTALLIDLDGVIRRWRQDDSLIEAAHGLPGGAIRRVAFSTELLLPAIEGAVSDEVWRANVARELNRQFPLIDADLVVAAWSASPGEVSLEVIDVLRRCHPDLRIVLATNATSRLTLDLQTLGLGERFHAIANSSELGVSKPQAAFYVAALQLAGAQPTEALFVDDSKSNVDAAAQLGIRGHHFLGCGGLADFLKQAGAIPADAP